MSGEVTAGIAAAAAAVVGEVFRRLGERRMHAATEQRVLRLGGNLGPRQDDLLDRVAYIEGKLGIPRAGKSGKMEGGPDAEHDGR